ncbi:unnamed protein product [Diabrotica balteata]|uniref:Uncharacterized protein n=1 Tax=Diabrotica balteata TaxID=107213 RepID=A0A9N9XG10_DIABA|nr:unnamed protein product [Diabrotica balteata]
MKVTRKYAYVDIYFENNTIIACYISPNRGKDRFGNKVELIVETSSPPPSPGHNDESYAFLLPPPLQQTQIATSQHTIPQITISDTPTSLSRAVSEQPLDTTNDSRNNSRRASAIIQALRRPSQAIALSAAQAIMNQRRYIMGLFNDSSETSKKEELDSKELGKIKRNRRIGEDALSIILSALYAKLVVVLGIAFPVIEVISTERPYFYQSFYIYLYLGSIVFVTYMYATLVKEKALVEMINSYNRRQPRQDTFEKFKDRFNRTGSANSEKHEQKKTSVTEENEMSVLMAVTENPLTSIRSISNKQELSYYLELRTTRDIKNRIRIIFQNISLQMLSNVNNEKLNAIRTPNKIVPKYGSFYLRLGAIAFGIGSMVYSGLEFGRYFELKNNPECNSNILQALTPVTRMVLTLVQVQFIFLNSKDIDFNKHKLVARFGIMHMIATNLSEWLYVLVEETKHEIVHLSEHRNTGNISLNKKFCQEGLVMSSLVANASPFLFPCTIEYSLICAVILFEMWKRVKMTEKGKDGEKDKNVRFDTGNQKVATHFQFNQYGGKVVNSNHHFTIDCSNAHKGLFAGILVSYS